MVSSKKSKPSFWQQVSGKPSQSYAHVPPLVWPPPSPTIVDHQASTPIGDSSSSATSSASRTKSTRTGRSRHDEVDHHGGRKGDGVNTSREGVQRRASPSSSQQQAHPSLRKSLGRSPDASVAEEPAVNRSRSQHRAAAALKDRSCQPHSSETRQRVARGRGLSDEDEGHASLDHHHKQHNSEGESVRERWAEQRHKIAAASTLASADVNESASSFMSESSRTVTGGRRGGSGSMVSSSSSSSRRYGSENHPIQLGSQVTVSSTSSPTTQRSSSGAFETMTPLDSTISFGGIGGIIPSGITPAQASDDVRLLKEQLVFAKTRLLKEQLARAETEARLLREQLEHATIGAKVGPEAAPAMSTDKSVPAGRGREEASDDDDSSSAAFYTPSTSLEDTLDSVFFQQQISSVTAPPRSRTPTLTIQPPTPAKPPSTGGTDATESMSSSNSHLPTSSFSISSSLPSVRKLGPTTPSLAVQPPTTEAFPIPANVPLPNSNSSSPTVDSPSSVAGLEQDLFSEHSLNPGRRQQVQRAPALQTSPKTFASSPLSFETPLFQRADGVFHEEYYKESGQNGLEDDSRVSWHGEPPRSANSRDSTLGSSSHFSTSSSSQRGIGHSANSATPFSPAVLRRVSRPDSVRSSDSTASRYSQASFRSELDASPPAILASPAPSIMSAVGGTASHASSRSHRGHSQALSAPSSRPGSIHTPYDRGFTVPPAQTPFLPRPSSALLDSYAYSAMFPSAPTSIAGGDSNSRGGSGSSYEDYGEESPDAWRRRTQSNVSDSGKREFRKSVLGGDGSVFRQWEEEHSNSARGGGSKRHSVYESGSFAGDLRSVRSFDTTGQHRPLPSEVGGIETVSKYTLPQVLDGAARGEGGTSISGGSAYSTLTLPSGAYRPSKSPARYTGKLKAEVVGMPSTSMSTLAIESAALSNYSSATATSILRRPSATPTPMHLRMTPSISLSFSSHTPPPRRLSSSTLLIRIWAVALDQYDADTAKEAGKGFIPGRSFVGKVLEWGDAVKGFSKGDLVFGLLSVRKSGALSEFVVVERRSLALAPPLRALDDPRGRLTLEDVASLPLLGIPAHRAVGGVTRGSRALVLIGGNGHGGTGTASDWAVGVCAAQELIARGVIVVVQVPEDWRAEWAHATVGKLMTNGVKLGEPLAVLQAEYETSYEYILDCEGGARIYTEARRVLVQGGCFVTLRGDGPTSTSTTPTASFSGTSSTSSVSSPSSGPPSPATKGGFSSFRRAFSKRDSKKISYAYVSPSGAGPIVDSMGEDIRDILEWIAATHPYRPIGVNHVVPFERGAEAFAVIPKDKARGGGRYACEEDIWAVRLVG